MAKRTLSFTDLLVQKGLVSPTQISAAAEAAGQDRIPIQDAIIKLGFAKSSDVMKAYADSQGYEYVYLEDIAIPPNIIEMVPESVARENTVIPLTADESALTVVTSKPDDFALSDKLQFILNKRIKFAVASKEAIVEAISRHYGGGGQDNAKAMLQEFTDTQIDFTETDDDEDDDGGMPDNPDSPVVKLVHLIISEAVQSRASDIHIEPFEDRVRIRYRIDGVLVERNSPPRRMLGAILSRIKILSKLDIAERRRTQDGRIKVTLGEKELDLRVSVIPTNHGQSVVMRILDKDSIKVGLRQLGFVEEDYNALQTLIRRPNGIVLVTGPTGSGKTTSLYAALNELNTPDRKIITAEDPVEYYLAGINQVEIKHEIGLDFARVIRAMLRQAPNVILVGEMRDLETAQMGIQASLTGHLVFSTLHTNDAPSAVTRLADMKVPYYLIASSVIAIMAQRLVRRVCPKCKTQYTPSPASMEAAGLNINDPRVVNATFMHGKGCPNCSGKGFRGRMGIYELMRMSSKIRELTFAAATTGAIRTAAIQEGMSTLYWDGIKKAFKGVTTIDEVMRVAKLQEE